MKPPRHTLMVAALAAVAAGSQGGGTPERFTRLLEDDIARWKRVVSAANIHAD